MSKKKRKIIGIAVVLLALIMLGTPALAQNLSKTIDVFYRDIKIYVDGEIVIPKDATGRTVEPFIYDGTVYLPARAITEALGESIRWDGASNSVFIGESNAQEITEVTVGTAEELIGALGSNMRILLEEGVYNLSTVNPGYINNPSIRYEEKFDGPELILDNVHNLTIQGVGDKQSEIIAEPRYAWVMNFQNCSNVNISNVKAGHSVGGYCDGGVFLFENSSGIVIDDTLMYGCGTYGLTLSGVMGMSVMNSSIYECTYGIMNVYYSSDILFKECVFRDNMGFTMVDVEQTSGFTIDSCTFLRNTNDPSFNPYPMFSISQSEYVSVKNTLFEDNVAGDQVAQGDIEFDASNVFKNNSFDKTP